MTKSVQKTEKQESKHGVFMSGATGFVGSNLAAKMLLEGNCTLYCLVRDQNGTGEARLRDAVCLAAKNAGINPDSIKDAFCNLIAIRGDITKPLLGISDNDMQLLKENSIKQIWHLAAYVKHDAFFREEIMLTNVEGTKNIIDVAGLLQVSEFYYMSTAYVAGKRAGEIDESLYNPCFEVNNCYEESKRKAEDIIVSAAQAGAIQAGIFRPSIIIGNSKTGQADSQSEFYAFLRALEHFIEWITDRISDYYADEPLRLYCPESATINVIPVDTAVDEIIKLSKGNKASVKIYNIVNPVPVSQDLFFDALGQMYPTIKFKGISDSNELNEADFNLNQKIRLSCTPFMAEKSFVASRVKEQIPMKFHYTLSDLSSSMKNFIMQYRALLTNQRNDAHKLYEELKIKTIECRFGKTIEYYKTGHGPAMMMLNGYGADNELFKYLINYFSKSYKIFVLEYRGVLDHHLPNKDFVWGVDEYVEDIKEILDAENVTKCNFLGYCEGAVVAFDFYKKYSSFVESYSFINGAYFDVDTMPIWATSGMAMASGEGALAICNDPELAEDYAQMFAGMIEHDLQPESLADRLGMPARKNKKLLFGHLTNEEYLRNDSIMMTEASWHTLDDFIDKIDVPTLIISGQNDSVVLPAIAEIPARKIKSSYYYLMPAAAHPALMENAEECIEVLTYFYSHCVKHH